MSKRPHTLDPTLALLTEMRGDRYPPTNHGMAQAIIELVPHVENAHGATIGPRRSVLWITLRRPWWSWLALGFKGRVRRKIRRVLNRYGEAGVAFEVKIS